ncbi:hypothetical protein JCM24511_03436 [Saitozyma sp. JCM 24511]|nr:hypothetical protein JCM24511_03436 [Saitozyma sp. JCM 24511]
MSLLAPRPAEERASVVLPSITCSSCGAPIPLSSMGEHVCRPAQSAAPRMIPRPPQLTIPSSSRAGPSSYGPRSAGPEPSPAFSRPYASSSSSKGASPASLNVPLHVPSPNQLSPHSQVPSPAFGPPSTPSPTNPFFPHSASSQGSGTVVHGLGLGVGAPQGPYPTDAPLPAGVHDPMTSMPNTMSGGGAGMAGVGRRAFAAAAWGVTASVALARSAARAQEQAALIPESTPTQRSVSPAPPPAPLSASQAHPPPQPWNSRPDASPREPPLLPKVPLSGRQRSGTVSAATQAAPVPRPPSPQRAPSAMSQRSAAGPSQHSRKESVVSSTSSRRSDAGGDSVVQLLKAPAQGEREASKQSTKPFFDRVKQLTASSTGSTSPSATTNPMGGFGMSRQGSNDGMASAELELVESPQQTTFNLSDEDDDLGPGSALPWATPSLAISPQIPPPMTRQHSAPLMHERQATNASESSSLSSSSSRSGRFGRSGGSAESELVVTPSQSWEGLVDGAAVEPDAGRRGLGIEGLDTNRDLLEQIGEEEEEDEGDRVVFGALSPKPKQGISVPRNQPPPFKHSHSTSTIASARPGPSPSESRPDIHARSLTAPVTDMKRSGSSSTSSSTERRRKECVKCGELVGGSKRFVERDGIILCEKDWKKLYLPSCRRCSLPIEKSAVSSSDGQLKGKWHRHCFTCTKCDQPFEGDSFYVLGGKPWCQQHYHEENGTLCASASCRQPIEGACILTPQPNQQRFHPGHLRCDHRGGVSGAQTCREPMDEYYEVGDGRYCERHVGDAMRRDGKADRRAEKRRTRMVDLPVGGF